MKTINIARSRILLSKLGLAPKIPAFLHVPKTGGTYVAQWETADDPVISPMRHLGHDWVVHSLETPSPGYPPKGFPPTYLVERRSIEPYFVFTTVRNPFSFLISYMGHAGGLNPKYNDPNHYDYTNARKGFEYLLKTIVNRDEPWPSRKLLYGQFFCDDGDLIVDWINHTESLDDELEIMAKHHGVRYNRRPPQRIGHNDDYRTYYTDELIDLVNNTWARDLELFGYEFNGRTEAPAILQGEVKEDQKKGIHYYLAADELILFGKTLRR